MLPLIIGHGGNTGSQSNATIIRSLALGHIKPADWLTVVWKVSRHRVPCCYRTPLWWTHSVRVHT